ncbi:hypothetical protein OB13_11890 [Pontibacter sp. HJ8]
MPSRLYPKVVPKIMKGSNTEDSGSNKNVTINALLMIQNQPGTEWDRSRSMLFIGYVFSTYELAEEGTENRSFL